VRKRPEECAGRRSTIRPDVASAQQAFPGQPPEHWGSLHGTSRSRSAGGGVRDRSTVHPGRGFAGDLPDRAGSSSGCDVSRQAAGALPVVNRGPPVVLQSG